MKKQKKDKTAIINAIFYSFSTLLLITLGIVLKKPLFITGGVVLLLFSILWYWFEKVRKHKY